MLFTGIKAQQEIVLSPQWTAQAQFAGYYVADAMGFYKKAGLKVSIKHTSVSNACIIHVKLEGRLAEGQHRIGLAGRQEEGADGEQCE